MARRTIHIEPTEEQWVTLDEIYAGYTPFVALVTDEHGEPTGDLWAERIVDDSQVRLYTIRPNGACFYEELEGLHQGWSKSDEFGLEIEEADDDEA